MISISFYLLQSAVYPYEHMDDWEKFNGPSLPKKRRFNSNLNMEDITDTDCEHAKSVCKDFKVKTKVKLDLL